MSTLNISSIAAMTPQTATPNAAATSIAPSANLASQNTFLQLLVAQLKNQDPAQPTDGTAFVTELAQFITLSVDPHSSGDLDTIVAALPSLQPAPTSPTTNTSTTNVRNK